MSLRVGSLLLAAQVHEYVHVHEHWLRQHGGIKLDCEGGGAMTLNAGLRGESHVARAVGALFSVTTLALVTGCDAGSQHVRIENYCDVAVQASYSTFVFQDPPDATNPSGYAIEVVEGAAIDVAAGASSALKIDINGAGYLVLRGSAGEWLTVSPLDTEAPPGSDGRFIKDGVFVVDGPVCAQVDG